MEELSTTVKVIWIIGIGVSLKCLIIQLFLFLVLPSSRKLDQKILTQLTVARLGNAIVEYLMLTMRTDEPKVRDAIFALYMQTDAALICWMFVFTKNLYDKVILVFGLQKISFVLVSVSVWLLTLPIGILCPFFLSVNDDPEDFYTFYDVYGIVKFVILFLNLLFFGRIFWVAISRRTERDLKGLLRTCVISFILVCITSLQALITDLTSYFDKDFNIVDNVLSVINSYQVLAITVIFVVLSKPSSESIQKAIVLKIKGVVV